MTDAPEMITAWGGRTRLGVVYGAGPRPMQAMAAFDPTAYRRASLPATDAQIKDHPKVKALVEALLNEKVYWDKKADEDLREQEADERIRDYPTPRMMTDAMMRADALLSAITALEKNDE